MEVLVPSKDGEENDDDFDEEFVNESWSERLWGLTEMFPEPVRNSCSAATNFTFNSTKVVFQYSRSALWVLVSGFTILLLPVFFEKERATMHEHQLQQQRQILLGPNAAVSGHGPSMMGMMPPGFAPPGHPM